MRRHAQGLEALGQGVRRFAGSDPRQAALSCLCLHRPCQSIAPRLPCVQWLHHDGGDGDARAAEHRCVAWVAEL